MAERKNYFVFILYIFSALGFIGLIINGFFNVDIGNTLTLISFLMVGGGLIALSNIVGIRKYLDDGKLDGDELVSIVLASVGFLVIVVAGLDLFNFSFLPDSTSRVIQGVAAFFLLIVITYQMVASYRRSP